MVKNLFLNLNLHLVFFEDINISIVYSPMHYELAQMKDFGNTIISNCVDVSASTRLMQNVVQENGIVDL